MAESAPSTQGHYLKKDNTVAMKRILLFIRKELQIEKSYRFNMAIKAVALFFQMAVFYYIGTVVSFGGYFSFVLIGLIFSRFFGFWLGVFCETLRHEQYWGTAEQLFLSPTHPLAIMIMLAVPKLMWLVIEIGFLIALGIIAFGATLQVSASALLAIIGVNSIFFAGLGLLSAAFVLYFKRGDPINWLVTSSVELASGVYFPLTVLPQPLYAVAAALPTTQALNMWRAASLEQTPLSWHAVAVQLMWGAVCIAAGSWAFMKAYQAARKKGTLGHY